MTAARLSTNTPRRGLRRQQAADYIGVSVAKFDEMVKDGRLPEPFNVDKCVIWDCLDLDVAFEALKDGTHEEEDTWVDVGRSRRVSR